MKYSDINIFCCPKCRGDLRFAKINGFSGDLDASRACVQEELAREVLEGLVVCADCHCQYPILESIPRFVKSNTYAASFGYQWKKFSRTQFDAQHTQMSKTRFYATAKWPDNLQGQLILEAGCGAGRFSGVALDTQAEVYSFDLSDAVEACRDNVRSSGLRRRHHLFQADIYNIPLPYEMFDKIFCFGVLQHCPDPRKACLGMVPFLKPQGELVFDCYLKLPLKDMTNPKYLLRPFLKWWKPSWLFVFCKTVISLVYDMKSWFAKIPLIGKFISGLLPIGPLQYELGYHHTVSEIKEIKALSMFDMLSPKYDLPQRISSVQLWLESAGLEILELTIGYNGINARARKKI